MKVGPQRRMPLRVPIRSRDPFTTAAATAITGYVKLAMGEPGEACSLLREAIESFERFGAPHIAGRFMACRAEAHLAVGDPVSARKLPDQALAWALGPEHGGPSVWPTAFWPVSRPWKPTSQKRSATERRARYLRGDAGALEKAHTHMLGAELAHHRGDGEACAHHLAEAYRFVPEPGPGEAPSSCGRDRPRVRRGTRRGGKGGRGRAPLRAFAREGDQGFLAPARPEQAL